MDSLRHASSLVEDIIVSRSVQQVYPWLRAFGKVVRGALPQIHVLNAHRNVHSGRQRYRVDVITLLPHRLHFLKVNQNGGSLLPITRKTSLHKHDSLITCHEVDLTFYIFDVICRKKKDRKTSYHQEKARKKKRDSETETEGT